MRIGQLKLYSLSQLEVLLATGAAADAPDDTGRRALHFAADLGHSHAAHVLLAAGADSSARNHDCRFVTDEFSVIWNLLATTINLDMTNFFVVASKFLVTKQTTVTKRIVRSAQYSGH